MLWIPTKGGGSLITTSMEALTMMSAAMALNLVLGYTGQISIGHSAFLGVGAYTTGICVSRWGFSPWVTFPLAFVLAFIVGVIVSFPASRIKGAYLALVTLALDLLRVTVSVGHRNLALAVGIGADLFAFGRTGGAQLVGNPLAFGFVSFCSTLS